MRKLATLSAVALLSASLAGCETMNSVGSFAKSIEWSDVLPWQSRQETVASKKPADETPVRMASRDAMPDGLQTDDLRKPFGTDHETAVASREGL